MEDELSPKEAADAIVDGLRNLLAVLGSVLATSAGQTAALAAAECRSVPSLAKALRQLWFSTPLEGRAATWDSKQQAVWLCRLVAVVEGGREGLLSFYGAGLLLCEALYAFAQAALSEAQKPMDDAWLETALVVQEALQGRHWEQLQRWPGDKRCGGGKDALLSTGRLPTTMRRTLDLDGVRLSKTQAAALGMSMFIPGSMTLSMGAVGCAVLVKSARKGTLRAWLSGTAQTQQELVSEQWTSLQSQCLDKAHMLMRRKARPIEVHYDAEVSRDIGGFSRLKVCLYSKNDPLCALPVGTIQAGGSTSSQSVAYLEPGLSCALRPGGKEDRFKMRVYQPAEFRDILLEDCIEARRGDNFVLRYQGGRIRCFAEALSIRSARTIAASAVAAAEAAETAVAAEAMLALEAADAVADAARSVEASAFADNATACATRADDADICFNDQSPLPNNSDALAAFVEAAAIAGGSAIAQQAATAALAAEAAVAAETAAVADAEAFTSEDFLDGSLRLR